MTEVQAPDPRILLFYMALHSSTKSSRRFRPKEFATLLQDRGIIRSSAWTTHTASMGSRLLGRGFTGVKTESSETEVPVPRVLRHWMLSNHRHSEICKGAGLRHRQPARCENQVLHPGRDGSPSLASLASRRLCYPPESGPATPATPCPGGFEIPILCAAAEESDILLTPEGHLGATRPISTSSP